MWTPPHGRSPTPTSPAPSVNLSSAEMTTEHDEKVADGESDSDVNIIPTSGPRRIKMRQIKAMPKRTAAEAVNALYLVLKRKRVDQTDDNRRQQRERERGPAGPSSYISRVPDDTRVVRVVFWIAHNACRRIIHARLSKNFVQLAAVPALMNFLQLHQDTQWDRWDEFQCTWTTNWTVHDRFWVSWGVSTILGRVHQPDPEAHGRVGGVVGLPGLGHELTRIEKKTPGMAHDPTPIVVHVLDERA